MSKQVIEHALDDLGQVMAAVYLAEVADFREPAGVVWSFHATIVTQVDVARPHVIDEGTLHRPVAPPAVMHDQLMHDQLMHLIDMTRLPTVSIQVVPYDARGHSGLLGAFVIADREDGASIVFVEDVTGGRVSEDAATVAEVALRFDALRSGALVGTPHGTS